VRLGERRKKVEAAVLRPQSAANKHLLNKNGGTSREKKLVRIAEESKEEGGAKRKRDSPGTKSPGAIDQYSSQGKRRGAGLCSREPSRTRNVNGVKRGSSSQKKSHFIGKKE